MRAFGAFLISPQGALAFELKNFAQEARGNGGYGIDLLNLIGGQAEGLLDRGLVSNSQTRELQAMGVVMGDLLAADLGLHWVIYQDNLGRTRALRDGESDTYLFPITMISRRREVDNRTTVAEIYGKAREIVLASRPPLPFQ